MTADLHTHSTASDGQYTPTQLVRLAKERGLDVLALTDHDTVDGLEEAVRAGEQMGIRVIRGIELSAMGSSGISIQVRGRDQRAPRIIAFLEEQGVRIPLSEVEALAGGQIMGRPHFAQVLVRHGYVSSNREAFDRYLDTEDFHRRVERPKPLAQVCVETIRAAGGKASLAHPYQIGVDNGTLEDIVRELAGCGLNAIECFYPRHTPEQQSFYLRLAEKYGLHATGGSDFHGERVKPDIRLAAWELETDWFLE